MIWFTSDEHFFHRNILKLSKRPFGSLEEMHSVLIENHNKLVKKDDLVYHLGDFCFRSTKKHREMLSQLNGKHILIMGNHDKIGTIAGKNAGFCGTYVEVKIRIEGETVLLKHYPYKPKLLNRIKNLILYRYELRFMKRRPKDNGGWLIHGHTHHSHKVDKRSINVCVEAWNYKPVSITTIEKIIKGRFKNK